MSYNEPHTWKLAERKLLEQALMRNAVLASEDAAA